MGTEITIVHEAPGGFFNRLFKRAPERKPSDQPASPIGVWGAQKRSTVTYQEAISAEKALKHPIVYRCLQKIMSSVASVDWYCEPDPKVVPSEQAGAATIKAINAVLQSPSDIWTRQQLLSWMALNFASYGRVPFKVGVGMVGGKIVPSGIYPLETRFFQTNLDKRGLVESFEYGEGESSEKLPTRQKASEGKAYAYEIVRPNLAGTFTSRNNVHPLGAIGLPSEVVMLLLRRAYDTASGHPNSKYIVVCSKTLTQKQKDAIKEEISNREADAEDSGQVLFLYNTEVNVVKLDNDLGDIHSKMPLDDMARQIVGAFGIPIALIGLGAADGAKFSSNYEESRLAFWLDTLIPEYLVPFATGLTKALCPYGARISFDYDSIEAILNLRVKNAERLAKVNFLTNDEKREMIGFGTLKQRAMDGGDQLPPETPPAPNKAPVATGDDTTAQERLQ